MDRAVDGDMISFMAMANRERTFQELRSSALRLIKATNLFWVENLMLVLVVIVLSGKLLLPVSTESTSALLLIWLVTRNLIRFGFLVMPPSNNFHIKESVCNGVVDHHMSRFCDSQKSLSFAGIDEEEDEDKGVEFCSSGTLNFSDQSHAEAGNLNLNSDESRAETGSLNFNFSDQSQLLSSSEKAEFGGRNLNFSNQSQHLALNVPANGVIPSAETTEDFNPLIAAMSDEEILGLLRPRKLPGHKLEKTIADHARAVSIRRRWLEELYPVAQVSMCDIPFKYYDYSYVTGACCENVIGYVPIPLGYAGPLCVDGKKYYIPLATTEGCLVASTNRGCKAVSTGSGVRTFVYKDGMTRAPVVEFPDVVKAGEFVQWLQRKENFNFVKAYFDDTSRFAKLLDIQTALAGRTVYVRFRASTGDAMGMNMVTKATKAALLAMQVLHFRSMKILGLSGNFCCDKKPAAINWTNGRGKSVVAEAVIPAESVDKILKTTVDKLVHLNLSKNFVGSALAGSIGGFNAHASNIVTAIFLATGQDAAQNISSSSCITRLEKESNGDLRVSCTMPCLEVGTIGGGTVLPPQSACLQLMQCKGGHSEKPGQNAVSFARLICATVLVGELSLLAELCSGDLVASHMTHNRSYHNVGDAEVTDCPSTGEKRLKSKDYSQLLSATTPPGSCSKIIT